jgi:predicted enzyme related to lactoylglutathione lyase
MEIEMSAHHEQTNPFGLHLTLAFMEAGDTTALQDFYQNMLGLPIRKAFGSTWIEYSGDGANIALHQPAGLPATEPPHLYLSFQVQRLDDLHSALTVRGIDCSPIQAPERGRFFTCKDPLGTRLHFIEFNAQWKAANAY